VCLDLSPPPLRELLELPFGRLERNADDRCEVLMEILRRMLNHDVMPGGDRHIDDDTMWTGALGVTMRPIDSHTASDDVTAELLELRTLLLDQTI